MRILNYENLDTSKILGLQLIGLLIFIDSLVDKRKIQ